MPCPLTTAALTAVCLTLPDLGEPRDVPDLPHWGIRSAYLSYKADKAIISRTSEWHGFHGKAAIGNTRFYQFDRNVLKNRKTLYFYLDRGDFGVMYMPMNQTLAVKWEFD